MPDKGIEDLLKAWEQAVPIPAAVAKTFDRIASILTLLCAPLGGEDHEFLIRNLDDKMDSFMVGTPWGAFALYNSHDDHWHGGEIRPDQSIRRMPGCFQLHEILRLHLLMAIDRCLIEQTSFMDGMPPPEGLH